jgi:autotransporter-associated beta strand protein
LSDVALNGANTYSGGTSIDGTYLNDLNIAIGNPSALGTGPVDLSYANLTENITNPTFVDLANGYSSSINLVPSSTLTLYADTGEGNYWAYEGAINGDGTDQVVKTGPGVEYLSGNSTYGGGTTVVAGHLIAGSSAALGTGAVTVDSGAGLGVDTGVTLTDPINNLAGSGLGGMGTFSPPSGVTFAGGSKVSPGSDGTIAPYIGTLSFGTPVTFGTGGIYVFDIANASGAAGVGYDTLNLTSSLTISATSGTPFNIAVESIDPGTSETGPASFNSSQSYTWTLLTAAPILGTFNSADFSVDLTNFQNSTGGGSFAVGETGDTLTLNFTPVPEPSTWMLMAAGLAALCIRYRRPRRA